MKEIAKKADEEKKAISLGPQSHSKPSMPMIPGSSEHFILDEINKQVKRT